MNAWVGSPSLMVLINEGRTFAKKMEDAIAFVCKCIGAPSPGVRKVFLVSSFVSRWQTDAASSLHA